MGNINDYVKAKTQPETDRTAVPAPKPAGTTKPKKKRPKKPQK
jgi:hypothetical protein